MKQMAICNKQSTHEDELSLSNVDRALTQ